MFLALVKRYRVSRVHGRAEQPQQQSPDNNYLDLIGLTYRKDSECAGRPRE